MSPSVRIFQLLKIRNQMSDKALRSYGLYFAIMLFLSYYLSRFGGSADFMLYSIMGIVTFYCAERQFFPQVKDAMNSIHFLTMPSQQWEKWLAEFIHTLFIIPAIALLPILLAVYVVKFLFDTDGSLSLSMDTIIRSVKLYWMFHPLMFFGAIYFRQSVVVKTFGSIALLAIASLIFVSTIIKLSPGLDNATNINLFLDKKAVFEILKDSNFHNLIEIAYYAFFWTMSYLSLKEVEN